jgi:Flp pilus assembly protein TadD
VADTLGWIYYKKQMFREAVEALQDAAGKQPANPGFRYRLGLAYAQNGNVRLARETLQTALKLDPNGRDANEARAVLSRLSPAGS